MNNNKKWMVVTLAALLLIVGVGWAVGYRGGDPQIAELERLRDDGLKRREGMTEEERRGQREQFREKLQNLSDGQRKQFFKNSRSQFQQFALQRMNEFFAKSPQEQREALDQIIDRMEQRSAERVANGGTGNEGRQDRMGGTPQSFDQRRKQGLDRTTPELRSMRNTFREMLNSRRQERGLEPIEGRPHWRRS